MTNPTPPEPRIDASSLLALVADLLPHTPRDALLVLWSDRFDDLAIAELRFPVEANLGRLLAAATGGLAAWVALIGYGSPERVDPALATTAAAFRQAGLGVLTQLRVTDGRSYDNHPHADADGRPRDGTAIDATADPQVALEALAAHTLHPDRRPPVGRG